MVPVIGYLSALSKAAILEQTAKFNRGLNEMGFVDGQNVTVEYRWAEGQYDRLPAMATELVRLHWDVENNCPHTLDDTFEEDARPWIKSNPRGMVVVAMVRRIAYTLLTLFRSVTQRSDERHATPWRDLVRWFYNAIISATDADLSALRPRPRAMDP